MNMLCRRSSRQRFCLYSALLHRILNAHSRTGEFRNVGEHLYRYSSNRVYYARFRNNGKLIHRSLRTTDREMAKRCLEEEITKAGKVDAKLSQITMEEILRL